MNALAQIPIRVLPAAGAGATIGGGVSAILMEIAARMEALVAGGEAAAIDLRSLPMSASDRQNLVDALGPGEVTIALEIDGSSTIRETGIRGVWWSEYRDRVGTVVAAFIEVAHVPMILPVGDDELAQGAHRLRAMVSPSADLSAQAILRHA